MLKQEGVRVSNPVMSLGSSCRGLSQEGKVCSGLSVGAHTGLEQVCVKSRARSGAELCERGEMKPCLWI